MKVQRFTTVAKTVAKKTIGLAHMHFAPSGDSYVFVHTDSAPLSDSYGLVHTDCKRSIGNSAAAGTRKSCVTGRHPSCVAVINPAVVLCNPPSSFFAPPPHIPGPITSRGRLAHCNATTKSTNVRGASFDVFPQVLVTR
jgi:hypothetical protein